jgi:hypothetical protein
VFVVYYCQMSLEIPLVERVGTKLETEQPKLWQYTERLIENLYSNSGWNKYLTGLYINCLLTHDDFYYLLLAASYTQAQRAGVNINLFENTPLSLPWKPLTPNEAGEIVASERSKGLISGFWHGHIRMLTPGSLIAGVIASESCDTLTVGIEEGWRTLKFKDSEELPYEGLTRATVLRASGIAENVVVIGSETEYSDEGYLALLKTISPNKYFVSEPATEELNSKYNLRATRSDSELVYIPHIPSFSTTQYLTFGGRTDVASDLLL